MARPPFDPRPVTLVGTRVLLAPLTETHAFEALGAHRVTLKTDGRNVRSQHALQRIGATHEGVLRRHRVCWDGFVRDSVYFGITDVEWPSVKTRLEAMAASR